MRFFAQSDIGTLGEQAAAEYYRRRGFSIITTNYRQSSVGEIDIVAEGNGKLIFIEVKSISSDVFSDVEDWAVNPGENIHEKKRVRLRKTIALFFREHSRLGREWRFDVALVQVNPTKKKARVYLIEDIVL
jgi:putative endonuclease